MNDPKDVQGSEQGDAAIAKSEQDAKVRRKMCDDAMKKNGMDTPAHYAGKKV